MLTAKVCNEHWNVYKSIALTRQTELLTERGLSLFSFNLLTVFEISFYLLCCFCAYRNALFLVACPYQTSFFMEVCLMAGRYNFNPLRSCCSLQRLGHMLELGWLFDVATL